MAHLNTITYFAEAPQRNLRLILETPFPEICAIRL